MNKGQLAFWDLVAKYLVIIVGAVWTAMVGTEFIDKKTAEYEFEALRLGSEGVYPRGDTQINPDGHGTVSNDDPSICEITGQYVITNVGEYLTEIESVKFQLYEIERLKATEVAKSDAPTSFSLSSTLSKLKPIKEEEFSVNESIAKGNELERSYGYLVKLKPGHNYAIVASAQGGIIGAENLKSTITRFRENDLTHISGSHTYCLQEHSSEVGDAVALTY